MRIFILLIAILLSIAGHAFAESDIRDSIVKIFCVSNSPDYDNPWNRRGPIRGYGSGCVIEGNRILTNAHVVSDHTFLQVQINGQAVKYNARVAFISHDADLALLTVDDPSFFNGVTALDLGELPQVMDKVVVYGFPEGGDTLSTTTGVISRIEHRPYAHSFKNLLAVQIDAAINPGNSGGPAIVDNEIVGIVMQQRKNFENIGYIVPATIVNHFLDDVRDGEYDGFPRIGISTQKLGNKNLKNMYGLTDSQTGVLVTSVIPGMLPADALIVGDILASVDNHPIADDGTVAFRRNERTSFYHFIQSHQYGDVLKLTVIREGQERPVELRLDKGLADHSYVSTCEYDAKPKYYIYGGLVFCPLTLNYLRTWKDWETNSPSNLLNYLVNENPSEVNEEVVVMIKVLESDINVGYNEYANQRIVKVNGREVINLKQMISSIEAQGDTPFMVFETERGEQLVLDNRRALAEHDEILRLYGVVQDRSEDLLRVARLD
jgi:S1-C subfamily serine protease